jgi:hypothetical protein
MKEYPNCIITKSKDSIYGMTTLGIDMTLHNKKEYGNLACSVSTKCDNCGCMLIDKENIYWIKTKAVPYAFTNYYNIRTDYLYIPYCSESCCVVEEL